MNKPVSTRITYPDFYTLKGLCKEFRISVSDLIRKAIYSEVMRLRNLSDEERMDEINDNVHWNNTKYSIQEAWKKNS